MTREEAIEVLETYDMSEDNDDEEFKNAIRLVIVALRDLKGEWIPISERLPEKTGLYLVNIGDLVTTANFDGHNFRTQAMVRFVPDAWRPLPEPYKAESERT